MVLRGVLQRLQCRMLFSACAVIFCVAGQQPTQTTAEVTQQDTPLTFGTSVNLVLVPVVVRDGQGHAVGSLKKEDFQVFDKGKPQEITKFSVEKAEETPIIADTSIETDANGQLRAKGAGAAAKPVAAHFILWLFDDLHLSFNDLGPTREAAKRVLRDSFAPGTRAAIYTTSGHTSLDFTDDRDKLEATLNEIKPWPTIPADNAIRPCPDVPYAMGDAIINRSDQQALLAAEADFLNCPDADDIMRKAGIANQAIASHQAGAPSTQDVSSYVSSEIGSLIRIELVKNVEIDFQDTRNTLLALKGLVRRMAAMPGSRTIVLVSPGFYLVDDHRLDETDIINNAIRNNVVISSLDARGLWALTPGGTADTPLRQSDPGTIATRSQYEQSAQLANEDILSELATDTGGTYFHNSNDFVGGLQRIATQPEYIYVLGFAPQNLKIDGSFHALKVSLKNGAKFAVEARRGYFERRHLENAAEEAKQELIDEFFTRDEMRELPVELSTQYFKTGEAKARLSVLSRIDAKHLKYRKTDGRNDDTITVVAGVFDRNGNYVVGTQKVVDLKLRDQTLDKLPASGITVKTNLDVASGEYIVRLVVRDSEGQAMSALNGAVVIP